VLLFRRPKGTSDIYGTNMLKTKHIEEILKEMMLNWGYSEIRTPIFEFTELFDRSVGNTSDIVQKEMYTFQDKGGRNLTLRPEGTAPVVRAYLENALTNYGKPLRLFYLGPMFRYERPQAGRTRQFQQFGIELIGSASPLAEVEVFQILIDMLGRLDIKDWQFHVNTVGCQNCRNKYLKVLKEYYRPLLPKLCSDCQHRFETNILRLLDCKNPQCAPYKKDAPHFVDHVCEDCKSHFNEVISSLDALHIPYVLDHYLVRGLDYYTRTAFEVKYRTGSQDALLGGGRYDLLIEQFGGNPTPAIGFAISIERLLLASKDTDLFSEHPLVYVITFDEYRLQGVKLAFELRKVGIPAITDVMGRNLSSQMKEANRLGVSYVIIVGKEEIESDKLSVKDMKSGEQSLVDREKIREYMITLQKDANG